MRRDREEEPLLNKDKMKTMAFSNLVGSIIFLAIGIWARKMMEPTRLEKAIVFILSL